VGSIATLTHSSATVSAAAHTPVANAITTTGRSGVSLTSLAASGAPCRIALARPVNIAPSLSEIALAWSKGIARALPEIARSWPRSVAGALPNITEALLSLGRSRSCINITSRTVELIRHVAVVVRHSTAVGGIVHPVIAVAHIHAIKAVAVDKVVVDGNVVAPPSGIPTPASPAAAPDRAYSDAHTE
jgi:hypothetical protein